MAISNDVETVALNFLVYPSSQAAAISMGEPDANDLSHRLPTVSASQALRNLTSAPKQVISTGLPSLDSALQGKDSGLSAQGDSGGGLTCGHITEIFGPPGSGKTAFALQAATNAFRSGASVIWIDASFALVGPRLIDLLTSIPTPNNTPTQSVGLSAKEDALKKLHHFTTPTLSHLFALLAYPSPSLPLHGTKLIVIDAVSSLFNLAFVKASEVADKGSDLSKKADATQWASNRRWTLMGDLISRLGKLAATKSLAILLTSQTTTRFKTDTGAILHPAITGTAWDSGIHCRIVLFQDWAPSASNFRAEGDAIPSFRFAGLIKNGSLSYEGLGQIVPFVIEKHCLREVTNIVPRRISLQENIVPVAPSKRKHGEVADSESEKEEIMLDEDFGWADSDDPLAMGSH
ncbi:MAG: hypothetical protein Q9167_003804 [Letrouitia subvulpina]